MHAIISTTITIIGSCCVLVVTVSVSTSIVVSDPCPASTVAGSVCCLKDRWQQQQRGEWIALALILGGLTRRVC